MRVTDSTSRQRSGPWIACARDRFCCLLAAAVGLLVGLGPMDALAQVAIPGTRVVFPAAKEEVVVPVRNMSSEPVLVQVWVADGGADQPPERSKAPFALAPPMVRLDPGKDSPIRIRQLKAMAPVSGNERLYWLNVLAVPSHANRPDENRLDVAIRSTYKVLFRPEGLGPPPADRSKSVTFRLWGGGTQRELVMANSSPYFVNLGTLAVGRKGEEVELENPYVPPMGQARLSLPADVPMDADSVRFQWIDDDGRLHPSTAALEP